MRTQLEGQLLESYLKGCAPNISIRQATTYDELRAILRSRPADAAIIDAAILFTCPHARAQAQELLEERLVKGLLFLDDRPNQFRSNRALEFVRSAYVTRSGGAAALLATLSRLLKGDDPVGELKLNHRSEHEPAEEPRLRVDSPVLGALSPRELEVMRILAAGHTLRECAQQMSLSPSTIDNHKSKLMKKLGVHKSIELALLAVREGLISP